MAGYTFRTFSQRNMYFPGRTNRQKKFFRIGNKEKDKGEFSLLQLSATAQDSKDCICAGERCGGGGGGRRGKVMRGKMGRGRGRATPKAV